jgi:pyruvate dehydrogenase E2 component (dihydrolipoamide acetyltransferase)
MGKLTRLRDVSSWRRIAMASWGRANDPTVYGTLRLDAGTALEYLARLREATGVHATMTHLVGRAVALALRAYPQINGRIVGRRFYVRDTVDLFFQVAMDDGGRELSGAKVDRADAKDVHEIARELIERAQNIRAARDPQFESTRRTVSRLPQLLLGPTVRFFSWLSNDHGIGIDALQLPPDQFGSVMITSLGMFGVDVGYAPIFPLANTPLLVLVGEVKDEPVAQGGQVVIRPMINLNVSFDHRFIDGVGASRLARSVRAYFAAPGDHEVRKLLAAPGT